MDSPCGFETANKTQCRAYLTFNAVLQLISAQCPGTLAMAQTPLAPDMGKHRTRCPKCSYRVNRRFLDIINIKTASKEHRNNLL